MIRLEIDQTDTLVTSRLLLSLKRNISRGGLFDIIHVPYIDQNLGSSKAAFSQTGMVVPDVIGGVYIKTAAQNKGSNKRRTGYIYTTSYECR